MEARRRGVAVSALRRPSDVIRAWHAKYPHAARHEAYVDAVLAHVRSMWLRYPHLRLSELLSRNADDVPMVRIDDEEFLP
jgi:hypothetical protein